MSIFTVVLVIVLSLLFLLLGGAKAAVAFWVVNGIIFAIVLTIIGLHKLLSIGRKGTVR